MRLLEYESKNILKQYQIVIPTGAVIGPQDTYDINQPVMLKAQIPIGGRGKTGGILSTESIEEADAGIKKLLSSWLRGYRATKILLEEKTAIDREFYLAMRDLFQFKDDQDKFEHAWRNVFFPMVDMLELSKKLAEDHEVYLLSNTDEIHFPFIWENFPQLHHFENNLMLSYELGCVKPDIEIYELSLNKFNLKAEDCIFIDDKLINVKAARDYGMTAIWHQSFIETKQILSKFLTEK